MFLGISYKGKWKARKILPFQYASISLKSC